MNKVSDLVLEVVRELGSDQENKALVNADLETPLFGRNLDSMGIVFLVTDLEARISEEWDLAITLADERAMSQNTSPFRSVKTLTQYTQTLLDEAKTSA
ncbi:hypothetical protein [Hydrogenovibrio halophilus]|uniref:hypothetical protein n=1 Tax=Hydrogenovibrio halophilus TaxID=373391 RepID=UPI00037A0DB7|nr:hypothetical protein [Hydrogenovibrio halophilus]